MSIFNGAVTLLNLAGDTAQSQRNRRSIRPVLVHWRGGIFTVQTEKAGLDDKLQALLDQCRGMNDGKNLPVHIGIYVEESEQVHVSVACDRAKMACSALSGRYETAVNYYSQNLSEDVAKRQYIIENIDKAIKEKRIQVYYNIYLIDLDTNEYIEYSSQIGAEEISLERHGGDFFESARRDAMTRIYEEDREPFLALFTKENVLRDIDRQGVFTTTYRLIDTGTAIYVNMKITRMKGGSRLILGVSNIDAHMKEKERFAQMQKEREMLVRVMALSDGDLTMFTVDPNTGHYIEYSSSEDFDSLGAKKGGDDFFGQAFVDAFTHCYSEDRQRFHQQVTMENVMREIRLHGSFSINYRLIIKGEPRPVTLKASLFKNGDDDKLVVGVRAWKNRA